MKFEDTNFSSVRYLYDRTLSFLAVMNKISFAPVHFKDKKKKLKYDSGRRSLLMFKICPTQTNFPLFSTIIYHQSYWLLILEDCEIFQNFFLCCCCSLLLLHNYSGLKQNLSNQRFYFSKFLLKLKFITEKKKLNAL